VLPGKLSYMSPEQAARGSGQVVDHRSDIFSLGIVLYEITVGRRLFRGTPAEIVPKLVNAEIEPPTFARRNFPPALESIVMRALEKHPSDRYQSAYDLADDLETFLRDERLHSGPVRIARYLDVLTHAAGGTRRPELVSEAEQRRADGDELDFDSQLFDGFKSPEGAPGPEQAREWEDTDQPEADVAAALGMELAELRALRTPVPIRPAGMAPVTGKETPRPSSMLEQLDTDDEHTAIDAAPPRRPTPPPLAPPAAPMAHRIEDPFVQQVLVNPLLPGVHPSPVVVAPTPPSRLPWVLVGMLGMAVLALVAYIVTR